MTKFNQARIAAAAVLTCSLGNSYPAKASTDFDAFDAVYQYGFLYGHTTSACMNYLNGVTSYSHFISHLEATEAQDSASDATKGLIVGAFQKAQNRNAKQGKCLPAVRQVFGRAYGTTIY